MLEIYELSHQKQQFPEERRKYHVECYQQRWQSSRMSLESYADEIAIHHTTLRMWLKRYAPNFWQERKMEIASGRAGSVIQDQDNGTPVQTQLTVETEWYQHEKTECIVSQTENDPVPKLLEEIRFLKEQVAYWMRQERIA